jgi:predicted DsbA family dithiol-disulfide isomerase
MTYPLEEDTCSVDGCIAEVSALERKDTVEKTKMLSVEIVSDTICPWCYVAKRQFERAVAGLPGDVAVSVHWKPFELNPDMPVESMDRVAYRSRKFGSWEYSQKLDAQVTAAAAQAGLTMHHDLMKRTPKTFNAHRLIWLAEQEGVQDAVVEALFSAYFVKGRDVGDKGALADLAAAAGIDRARASAFLAGTEDADEVAEAEAASKCSGINGVPTFVINGVPTFVINGRPAFSGAQRAELMLAHLLDAVASS